LALRIEHDRETVMSLRTLVIAAVAIPCLAADPVRPTIPKPPTTRPATTQPPKPPERVRDTLVNGSIRFMVPKDWELGEKTADGMNAKYNLPDAAGAVSLLVTQQQDAVPANHPKLKQQLTTYVLARVEEDLKTKNATVIDPPKVESDARFMTRVHVRFKEGDVVNDVVHIYRGVGINLLSVNASAFTDDPAKARAVHDAGALLLLSVTTGPADRKR
jgi:hypothetical protein